MNRILFIDDEPHFVEAHIEALKEAGYVVELAQSARDALEKLQPRSLPSLIILDIILPESADEIGPDNGMSTGLDLLKKIRGEYKLTIPIVILTVVANQSVHDQINAIERKFGHKPIVHLKPFLPSELLEQVKMLLSNKN